MSKTGVEVQLSGTDGNAFSIIGKVTNAMRRGGVESEVIKAFQAEAMSGDYDNLLRVAMDYCDVQ